MSFSSSPAVEYPQNPPDVDDGFNVTPEIADDQLEHEASRLVADMLATTPLALRLTKECLAASVDAGSLEQAVAMEDRNQVLCTQSSDFREGIRAFLAKRTPNYTDS